MATGKVWHLAVVNDCVLAIFANHGRAAQLCSDSEAERFCPVRRHSVSWDQDNMAFYGPSLQSFFCLFPRTSISHFLNPGSPFLRNFQSKSSLPFANRHTPNMSP